MTVKGTKGYAGEVHRFIEVTNAIEFERLHSFFLKHIPLKSSKIMDIGSGSGRDAEMFSNMGHSVVAVEPCLELLNSAKRTYARSNVNWIAGSLPQLKKVEHKRDYFDFILCSAVWHHIDDVERETALAVIASLLKPKGIFALSLRNGPAGVGTHVFPTDAEKTIYSAKFYNLKNLLNESNQPSFIQNKSNVVWSKLVFQRIG